jgi:ribonuclease HIII
MEFELQPNVRFSATFADEEIEHLEWFEEYAGKHESGNRDLSAPLVTACAIAGNNIVRQWIKDGVRDSKNISSDGMIVALESKILKSDCV